LPALRLLFAAEDEWLLKPIVKFAETCRVKDNRAELHTHPGGGHGFSLVTPGREKVCAAIDRFLASLGYLQGDPTVETFGRPMEEQ
jgi:acetyl esterase/lipase